MRILQRLFFTGLCCLAITRACAQGTILFQNVGPGFSAPVFDLDGTTRLSRIGYAAQLYVGPAGATDSGEMVAVPGPTFILTGTRAGFFLGGILTVPGFVPGSQPAFQVRVWSMFDGPTYEAAVSNGGHAGASRIFDLKNPATLAGGPPPSLPPLPLFGLQSFIAETLIPEPSTWALALFGAVLVFVRTKPNIRLRKCSPALSLADANAERMRGREQKEN